MQFLLSEEEMIQGFPLLYCYSTELPMEEAFDEEKNLNNQGFFTYMEDIGRGQCKITVFIKDNQEGLNGQKRYCRKSEAA